MFASALGVLALALLGASADLQEGREQFKGMHYRAAVERLNRARDVKDLPIAERREVFDLLARSLAALGRIDEVEAAYAELLAVDPEAPAPEGAAPKIVNAYKRARARAVKSEGAGAEKAAPSPPPAPADAPTAEPARPTPSPASEPMSPRVESGPPRAAVITQAPADEHPRWVLYSMSAFAVFAAICGTGVMLSLRHDGSDRTYQQQLSGDLVLGGAGVAAVGAVLLWWTWR
jgi:hypothetical protein